MAELAAADFVDRLADHLASAPLSLARDGAAIELFSHMGDERVASKTAYSVLRAYDLRQDFNPPAWLAMQCLTVAPNAAGVLKRAEELFDRLRGADEQPVIEVAITNFIIAGIRNLRGPTIIGTRDSTGRVEAAFNFDATYRRVTGD